MNILGIGSIFSRGLGVTSLEEALRSGWRAPVQVEAAHADSGTRSAYVVDLDAVSDRTLLKKIRRADKLSKMCVLAAADALADSGIADLGNKRVGIILATAFGAHVTTFDFLDGILDYGDANVSPTSFSNSVHNAAASYVSSSLNIQGPTLTVTQFRFSFQSALQLGYIKGWQKNLVDYMYNTIARCNILFCNCCTHYINFRFNSYRTPGTINVSIILCSYTIKIEKIRSIYL